MVYTSYFGNRRISKDFLKVSIALKGPYGLRLQRIPELAPSNRLLAMYKEGNVSKDEYIEIYNRELTEEKLNKAVNILIKLDQQYGDNIVLLCYESLKEDDDFCHRTLAMDRLNSNQKFIEYFGELVREYEIK